MKKLLPAALLAAALTTPVLAVELNNVHADKSTVTFTAKQMGVAVDGRFKKFAAELSFDPAKPQGARASIDIEVASIDAGSPEANDEVVGKQWFNAKAFPTARFVLSSAKALGGNRYEMAGKLTIKGTSRDLTVPVTLQQDGKNAIFDGSFVLRRADFAIGEGAWADFSTVANEVPIRFHILSSTKK